MASQKELWIITLLQKFTSSLCAFTFIFFAFVSKKILKKVLHLKYFDYLRNQIPILLKQS